MKKRDVYAASLTLHKKYSGKLKIGAKCRSRTERTLRSHTRRAWARVSRAIGKNIKARGKYTLKCNTVAIVSDGSAILGLGNLGAEAAIPVMEGKAILFKAFANVDAFPICLNTQDPDEIVETVKRIAPVFGGINLEDISAPRCFEIEARLKKELKIPVMHDDQHGTATVVLAALINALKVRGLKKEKAKLVVNGAGAAGNAIAQLLLKFGFKSLILVDSKGAIYEGRPGLDKHKKKLAKLTNKRKVKGGWKKA